MQTNCTGKKEAAEAFFEQTDLIKEFVNGMDFDSKTLKIDVLRQFVKNKTITFHSPDAAFLENEKKEFEYKYSQLLKKIEKQDVSAIVEAAVNFYGYANACLQRHNCDIISILYTKLFYDKFIGIHKPSSFPTLGELFTTLGCNNQNTKNNTIPKKQTEQRLQVRFPPIVNNENGENKRMFSKSMPRGNVNKIGENVLCTPRIKK